MPDDSLYIYICISLQLRFNRINVTVILMIVYWSFPPPPPICSTEWKVSFGKIIFPGSRIYWWFAAFSFGNNFLICPVHKIAVEIMKNKSRSFSSYFLNRAFKNIYICLHWVRTCRWKNLSIGWKCINLRGCLIYSSFISFANPWGFAISNYAVQIGLRSLAANLEVPFLHNIASKAVIFAHRLLFKRVFCCCV